ncbi:hypothetical protein Tco_0752316 [Tanacetum coccineum]|uniref:Uncharacterized protein n=1 Tax=Tanacetum coccineum TaxID=301880 RepID=A0ABQ4Z7H0_9ASTR
MYSVGGRFVVKRGVFQSERLAQAQIRCIFLDGYGVLVVRIVIFKISPFKLQNACLLVKFHQEKPAKSTALGAVATGTRDTSLDGGLKYFHRTRVGTKYPNYLFLVDYKVVEE